MNTYHWTANAAMIALVAIVALGAFGMVGCSMEGDTYSGVVTNVDCAAATTTTGQPNCGSGVQTDDHSTEEIAAE